MFEITKSDNDEFYISKSVYISTYVYYCKNAMHTNTGSDENRK